MIPQANKDAALKIHAALQIIQALAEAIRELKQVPAGVLYSQVIDKVSLNDFNAAINTLKGSGLVTEQNHLLIWVEPAQTVTTDPHNAFPKGRW